MKKLKYSKFGIISFLLALIPIIYVFIQTLMDIFIPVKSGFNKSLAISYFLMNLMFAISLVSFVLGIIAIIEKEKKKSLPIIAVIISGLILLIPIFSTIKSIIKIVSM